MPQRNLATTSTLQKTMESKVICRHVYELVGSPTCPDCGRDTHETDRELQIALFKNHYKEGKHLSYKCPIEGGTIRGWWSI